MLKHLIPNKVVPLIDNLTPKAQLDLARYKAEQIAARRQMIAWNPDSVQWIQDSFRIPELQNEPIILAPYQRAVLHESERRDESGNLVYSTVVWSDIKKSIKSTIAAAKALHLAWSLNYGSIVIIANDLKQADSRVGYYLKRAIELDPKMKAVVNIRNYRMDFPNKTFVESVAIDPTGEAGSNADLIIFSELWGAHQEAQKRMWTEMTLSPTKFGKSQRWVETYAGYSGESPLLEQLYNQGVNEGRRLKLKDPQTGEVQKDLEVYANDALRLLVLWNTQPRLSWQTPDYYAQEAGVLDDNEFQRVHRNQWVSSAQTFVPPEWWEACKGIIPAIVKKRTPLVFAIDAGVTNDCFALVGVGRIREEVFVMYSRVWKPPKGGSINFAEPEAEIRRLAKEYNVVEWAYDAYQLHDMCTRLGNDAVGWFNKFSQASERLVADKQLHDIIRDRRIVHDGSPVLSEHIKNANAQLDKEKMRLVKRADHLKIDLAVGLSMASYEVLRLNLG